MTKLTEILRELWLGSELLQDIDVCVREAEEKIRALPKEEK